MEIKILCPCGQKLAFEVEPVNGEMPQAVDCPACGADVTPLANDCIRECGAGSPGTPRVRLSVAGSPPAPDLPVSQQPDPVEPTPPTAAPTPRSGRPAPRSALAAAEAAAPLSSDTQGSWWAFGKSVIWVLVVSLVTFYACVGRVRRQMKAMGVTPSQTQGTPTSQWVLPEDDGTMLLVKGTNVATVIQLTTGYWKEGQGRTLTPRQVPLDAVVTVEGRFVVRASFAGGIQIDGPVVWTPKDAAALEGLARHLSQNLRTMVVSAAIGDDAEWGHVSIFDSGQRMFACDRQIRLSGGDLQVDMKVEGQPWATSKGFQLTPEDWKTFSIYEADELVQHLGFKPAAGNRGETVTVLQETATR